MTKEQILEAIEQMTVLELAELVKALEEKFGVSAAAPVAVAAAVPGAGAAAPAEAEEKTEFDVILTSAGDKKIQVIKVVRELTGPSLFSSSPCPSNDRSSWTARSPRTAWARPRAAMRGSNPSLGRPRKRKA